MTVRGLRLLGRVRSRLGARARSRDLPIKTISWDL